MNTILVDDEIWTLDELADACAQIDEINIVGKFQYPTDSLEFSKDHVIELAFLDVEMPGINGLDLAQELRRLYPMMIVIFISAHDEYMSDAFDMDADYYVKKPYRTDKIQQVLSRTLLLARRLEKKIFIKTFGNFDVFVDGKVVHFSSAKSKELLAYLVDRKGSMVTSAEGFSILWEDEKYTHENASKYRKVTLRLKEDLIKNGIENIVQILPRGRALNVDAVECDYFQFLKGTESVRNSFNGEYMTNYSWGEFTLGALCNMSGYKYE